MAKKPTQKPQFELKGFVSCELTLKQKEALRSMECNPADLLDFLNRCADSGYKCAQSYDYYNSCFTASLTDKDSKRPAYGWTLTAKGSSVEKALLALWFKHEHLLERDWSTAYDQNASEGVDFG